METKIFQKNCCLSSGETIKAHSLSYYRVWQASMDQLWGSFRSSNKYCASFKISFLGSKKWLETFFLKSYLSSRKKIFWLFFLVLSSMTNVTDSLWGFTRYTDKYCGSYRILSLAPKRLLGTDVIEEKKAIFPVEKILRPIFLVLSSMTSLSEQSTRVH